MRPSNLSPTMQRMLSRLTSTPQEVTKLGLLATARALGRRGYAALVMYARGPDGKPGTYSHWRVRLSTTWQRLIKVEQSLNNMEVAGNMNHLPTYHKLEEEYNRLCKGFH